MIIPLAISRTARHGHRNVQHIPGNGIFEITVEATGKPVLINF
jgi:hypothetical protein